MMQQYFANMAQPVVIELDALLRDYLLGLVLLVGSGEAEGLPVQWVHSSDLLDPSPFLTPRTVLLTTGRQFDESLEEDEAEQYVERLIKVGTTALGVGIGVQWDRVPPPLIAACDKLQLPLFRVPYDTPFLAVVRTAARLLEAESHISDSWVQQGGPGSMFDRRRNLAAAEQGLRRAVLTLLVEGRRELAEQVAEPLLPRLPRRQVSALSFFEPQKPKVATEIAAATSRTPGVFAASHNSQLTVIAEPGELPELRRLLTSHGIEAGISERGNLSELAALVEQAERAAELARLRGLATPLSYRPEMHAGVLQLLQGSPEAARRAQGLLAPLKQHDDRHQDDLIESLNEWLSHHGQTSAAAAALGVHRHTLRARITTAASLLQRNLDDPDTRAELWAALRIAQ